MSIEVPKLSLKESPELVRARAGRRTRGVGVVLIALLAGVGLRGIQLCLLPSEQTIASAQSRWGSVKLPSRRGAILDRHGKRLAASVATPNVVVDPARVKPDEVPELASKVADILGIPVAEVEAKMRRTSRYSRLAARVHPSDAARIDDLHHRALWSERGARRYYPEQTIAAGVLGFVDASGRGRSGIESYFDEQLRGGSLLLQRRRDRRGLSVDKIHARDDMIGMDVHTTLDRSIQRIAERALDGVLNASDPVSASIVVMDVDTGDVLAMASAPSFNPNAVGANPGLRRNHTIQDAFEPGSVIKPFVIAAAVNEGLASTSSWINCEGGRYKVGRVTIHDDHPHKTITVSEVLKYSSNIGTAKLALRLGADRVLSYLHRFGFGQRSGIHLGGERRGRLRDADKIKPIELATTAYGQGMTATPLQVATATATLARGGVAMRPRLIQRVEDVHGVLEFVQTPTPGERVVGDDVARSIARALVTVTERGGTATKATVPGYLVAAKTGTAHKVVNGRYSKTARVSSMMGFVPADDPKIAIVVMVDEARRGSRYGGSVAGPAFSEVAGRTLRYLGVMPNPDLLEPVELASIEDIIDPPVRLAWSGATWTVPDFAGLSMREVLRGVQGTGLQLSVAGTGHVHKQTPPAGARIAPGETLKVTFN